MKTLAAIAAGPVWARALVAQEPEPINIDDGDWHYIVLRRSAPPVIHVDGVLAPPGFEASFAFDDTRATYAAMAMIIGKDGVRTVCFQRKLYIGKEYNAKLFKRGPRAATCSR